ncbi:DNA polymerase III subunit psi [Escherichia coli]|nr:DNA polymerase III subunit psi [Escherichia coli]
MTSRRDWQLQQLGITQWSLRRPGALQGRLRLRSRHTSVW